MIVEPQPQAAREDVAGLLAGVLQEVGAGRGAGIEREPVELELAFAFRGQRFLDADAGGEPPPIRQYREVTPGHVVQVWGEEWLA